MNDCVDRKLGFLKDSRDVVVVVVGSWIMAAAEVRRWLAAAAQKAQPKVAATTPRRCQELPTLKGQAWPPPLLPEWVVEQSQQCPAVAARSPTLVVVVVDSLLIRTQNNWEPRRRPRLPPPLPWPPQPWHHSITAFQVKPTQPSQHTHTHIHIHIHTYIAPAICKHFDSQCRDHQRDHFQGSSGGHFAYNSK